LGISEKQFHKTITSFNFEKPCFDDDWIEYTSIVSQLDEELAAMATTEVFDSFAVDLKQKGLNKTNAYQFIKGHELENHIVKPLVEAITKKQNLAEFERIKNTFPTGELDKRRREMNHHYQMSTI
jgi:hypothetical protein